MYFNVITLVVVRIIDGKKNKTDTETNVRKILGDRITFEVFFNKLRKYISYGDIPTYIINFYSFSLTD